jgi:hypothetical protein
MLNEKHFVVPSVKHDAFIVLNDSVYERLCIHSTAWKGTQKR